MNSMPRQFEPRFLAISLFGVAFTCSACATNQQTIRPNPSENGTLQAIYRETTQDPAASRIARKSRSTREASPNSMLPAEDEVKPQIHRDPMLQQIAYTEEAIPASVNNAAVSSPQTVFESPIQTIGFKQSGIDTCPPEPRMPAAGANPMAPGMMACDACNLPSTQNYPDEYLCNGDDRDLPVHYDKQSRLSLETEDTVLEFTDRRGNEQVKAANRVCIYSPKFGSVRTVSRPHEDLNSNEPLDLGHMASIQGMKSRLKISHEVQREMTGGVAMRSRASGLESEIVQGSVQQLRSLSAHDKVLNLYQAFSFVRTGRIDDTETARLRLGMQAAIAWTREEYPVIASKTDGVVEGRFEQSTAVITGIEEKEDSEHLRIVKLANKQSASTGDTIEFTIRYDNLGGREVHHIRIVDNLTPRLAYIDDSGTSDRDGKLILQDNGEGSQILIWEIDEPLKGKTGGVVTFKARVR